MDLDELQSVQSRERQTDSLQQLRATFYQDAAEYIHSLEAQRDEAAERASDPWNSAEVGRLNDDIDTADQTVEAIYERRVGKIVKMASLAAADMPTEDEGLTAEERELFETLVDAIEENRQYVFSILDGDDPDDVDFSPDARDGDDTGDEAGPAGDQTTPVPPDEPPVPPEDADPAVDAANLMGGPGDDDSDEDGETPPEHPPTDSASEPSQSGTAVPEERSKGDETSDVASTPDDSAAQPATSGTDGATSPAESGSGETDEQSSANSDSADESEVERTTVRITSDVGEIFGVDQRAYDLTEDDVVTLPEPNATPLLDSGEAERLD